MFAYKAYGLAVISDVEFPELPQLEPMSAHPHGRLYVKLSAANSSPRSGESPQSADAHGAQWFNYARTAGGYLLRYSEMADFFVDARGCRIECVAAERHFSVAGLRHLLLDQVIPRVMNLRGLESLHATAIAVGERVCAFIGTAGTGKSTLAASFQLDGYPSVCDDCLVLRETTDAIMVTPGYPGVRLWEDSLEALALKDEPKVSVAGYTSKFRLLGDRTPQRFCDREYPLARIYALSRDESGRLSKPRIEAIPPAQAFPLIVRASYPLDFADQVMLERHFRIFTKVANRIAVRSLEYPSDLAALSEVRQAVLQDTHQN